MLERWEIVSGNYSYNPKSDKHICCFCKHSIRTAAGIWRHIENKHNDKILEKQDASIKKEG